MIAPDRHGILLAGTLTAVTTRALITGALGVAGLLVLAATAETSWVQLFGQPALQAWQGSPASERNMASTDSAPSAAAAPATALASRPAIARWSMQADPAGSGLSRADRERLTAWINYLQANPGLRVQLTLDNRVGADSMPAARRLAFVVQYLARGGIDPHRVQLMLLPADDLPAATATAPMLAIGIAP